MNAKIKILFFASNPDDATQLHLDEEIRSITMKIRASDYHDSLDLISAWAVRPDDLLQELNARKPTIVHFSGHGSRRGELVLMNDLRQPKTVSPSALKALFSILKDNVRLVVLNACHSKAQATAIANVIDCVVGMNAAMSDQAAITFAASFYRAMGFNRSIKEAFEQGKTSLLLEGIPEEDVPILITRTGVDPSSIFLLEPSAPTRDTRNMLQCSERDLRSLVETILPSWNPTGDVEELTNVLLFILQKILRDRWTESDAKGGWGHTYRENFLPLLYPNTIPEGISSTPDSITFTAWVLEGLACLVRPLGTRISDFPWVESLLREAKGYLDLHYDAQTGGSGPVIRGTAGDLLKHVNIRHTAAAVKAAFFVPACLEQAMGGVRYLIRKSKEINLSGEKTGTLAEMYWVLEKVSADNVLLNGIGGYNFIRPIRAAVVAALMEKFDYAQCRWLDGEGDEAAWLLRIVQTLRCVTSLSFSPDSDTRRMFMKGVDKVIDNLYYLEPDICGLPFFHGEEPDIGMTAMFLYALGKADLDKAYKELIKPCAKFLRKYYRDERYLRRSNSWTLSTILICAESRLL